MGHKSYGRVDIEREYHHGATQRRPASADSYHPDAVQRGERHLRDPGVAFSVPFAQRHEPVAGAGAVSGAEGLLSPGLRPDRPDHAGLPAYRIDAATGGGPGHRSPPAAVFAAHRNGMQPDRPADALGRP